MANKYKRAGAGDYSANASWSTTSGGAADTVVPAAGDVVILDANSGQLDLDYTGAGVALGGWNMTDFASILSVPDGALSPIIDCDGALTIGGTLQQTGASTMEFDAVGSIAVLAGANIPTNVTIKHNSATAAAYTIQTRGLTGNVAFIADNAGITSLTATEDAGTTILWKSFEKVANGKYAGEAFNHNVGGNLLVGINGVFTQTGIWTQTASGNVHNVTEANAFGRLMLGGAGVTSTRIGNVNCKAFEYGAGSVAGNYNLIVAPGGNNFWTNGAGSISGGTTTIYLVASSRRCTAIISSDTSTKIYAWGTYSLTMDGALNVGANALAIYASRAGAYLFALDMTSYALTAGAVTLGLAGGVFAGKLTLGGVNNIASLACAGTATTHKLNLGSASVQLTGTITGTNILPTSKGAHIHGGILSAVAVPAGDIIHRFGPGADTGNSGAIVNCPAPCGPGAALMAA